MSQYDFGDLESPLSGTAFFNTHLEPWRDALHSTHKGNSRPSYAVAGMIWVDDTTEPWVLKQFNGTANDVTLGTIDPTNFWFKPSGTSIWGGSAGGTANALTLTPTIPLTAYAAGVVYECLITATNTSSSVTVNISALGTKNVKASIGVGKVNVPVGALQNGMIARFVYDGTDLILLNVRAYNKGANIATAGTVNLDTATGDYVSLTGTTTVTAITLSEGQERTCHCAAAFTLTNGASLIVPTGANITTAAGDVFKVRGEASGVVRVVMYQKASGAALQGGGGFLGWEVFTANDTFDKANWPGLARIKATVTAGGGGGAGSGTSVNNTNGGCGAAGGTAIKVIDEASLSSSETVTVGAAGTAGTSSGNGGTGGTSSFGSHCSATGGAGGVSGSTGSVAAGGAGSGGDVNFEGGDGGSAGNTSQNVTTCSAGGASYWGGGGQSAVATAPGTSGGAYGAGGGSGARVSAGSAQAGGAGGPGIVLVEVYG